MKIICNSTQKTTVLAFLTSFAVLKITEYKFESFYLIYRKHSPHHCKFSEKVAFNDDAMLK